MPESQNKDHILKLLLAFTALYIIWGSTYIGIRFALESIPPFFMSAMRFLTAGTIMCTIARLGGATKPDKSQLMSTFILGILLLGFGNIGVVLAERTLSTGLVSLLVATIPSFVVLFQWILPGGRYPGARVLSGLFLGFAGLSVLLGPSKFVSGSFDLTSVGFVLMAAMSSAGGAIYSKSAKLPKSQALTSGLEMVFAGVVLLLISMGSGEFSQLQHSHISLKSILSVLYLVVFGSMIAFSAYVWLLQQVTPSRLSTYALVNPVVAVFLGWLLNGEAITPQTIFGAAIILSAVWLITQTSTQTKAVKVESNTRASRLSSART